MNQGLYAAATGMVTIEGRHETIANNIANASTAGFKRQNAVQEGFYSYFTRALKRPFQFDMVAGPGGGARMFETYSDLAAGALGETGNPLNVALQGLGYLAVDTSRGERFTRAGTFTIDVDGNLATPDGHKVQNAEGGAIDVRGGQVQIAEDGAVRVDGAARGRVRVVEFQDPHMLSREGDTLLVASEDALKRSTQAADTRVVQGYLELSNVSLAREMIDMTLGLRAYGANQRVVNSVDETLSRLIEQVGMPL